MANMRKVLWVVDGDKDALLERAKYVGAQAVCIRTTNAWLKGSVQAIKQWGFDVYAWRWPSVDPSSNTNHHYVEAEIDFVKGLIAAFTWKLVCPVFGAEPEAASPPCMTMV